MNDNRFFRWIDSVSLLQWLFAWFATGISCAIGYWLLTQFLPGHGLIMENPDDPFTFWDAVYFSFVSITTLGYGDIAPHGTSRLVAVVEAAIGVLVVGALVSKALSQNQEHILRENNELAFKERIARILTNIQFLLSEFQSVCPASEVQPDKDKDRRRMDNAIWTLTHVFRAIDRLLEYQKQIDVVTMQTLLSTLLNTAKEYCESRKRMAIHGEFELESEVHLPVAVALVCGKCMPAHFPDDLRQTADQLRDLVGAVNSVKREEAKTGNKT